MDLQPLDLTKQLCFLAWGPKNIVAFQVCVFGVLNWDAIVLYRPVQQLSCQMSVVHVPTDKHIPIEKS